MSPLPVPKADDDGSFSRIPAGDCFVADDMVEAVVLGNVTVWQRVVDTEQLALAAQDDFAGWCLPVERQWDTPFAARATPGAMQVPQPPALPFRFEPTARCEPAKRRATPPSIEDILEAGFGKQSSSGHRWWIPGLAAVMTFSVFSVLLLKQSLWHTPPETGVPTVPFVATGTDPVKPVPSLSAPAGAPVVAAAESLDLP